MHGKITGIHSGLESTVAGSESTAIHSYCNELATCLLPSPTESHHACRADGVACTALRCHTDPNKVSNPHVVATTAGHSSKRKYGLMPPRNCGAAQAADATAAAAAVEALPLVAMGREDDHLDFVAFSSAQLHKITAVAAARVSDEHGVPNDPRLRWKRAAAAATATPAASILASEAETELSMSIPLPADCLPPPPAASVQPSEAFAFYRADSAQTIFASATQSAGTLTEPPVASIINSRTFVAPDGPCVAGAAGRLAAESQSTAQTHIDPRSGSATTFNDMLSGSEPTHMNAGSWSSWEASCADLELLSPKSRCADGKCGAPSESLPIAAAAVEGRNSAAVHSSLEQDGQTVLVSPPSLPDQQLQQKQLPVMRTICDPPHRMEKHRLLTADAIILQTGPAVCGDTALTESNAAIVGAVQASEVNHATMPSVRGSSGGQASYGSKLTSGVREKANGKEEETEERGTKTETAIDGPKDAASRREERCRGHGESNDSSTTNKLKNHMAKLKPKTGRSDMDIKRKHFSNLTSVPKDQDQAMEKDKVMGQMNTNRGNGRSATSSSREKRKRCEREGDDGGGAMVCRAEAAVTRPYRQNRREGTYNGGGTCASGDGVDSHGHGVDRRRDGVGYVSLAGATRAAEEQTPSLNELFTQLYDPDAPVVAAEAEVESLTRGIATSDCRAQCMMALCSTSPSIRATLSTERDGCGKTPVTGGTWSLGGVCGLPPLPEDIPASEPVCGIPTWPPSGLWIWPVSMEGSSAAAVAAAAASGGGAAVGSRVNIPGDQVGTGTHTVPSSTCPSASSVASIFITPGSIPTSSESNSNRDHPSLIASTSSLGF